MPEQIAYLTDHQVLKIRSEQNIRAKRQEEISKALSEGKPVPKPKDRFEELEEKPFVRAGLSWEYALKGRTPDEAEAFLKARDKKARK